MKRPQTKSLGQTFLATHFSLSLFYWKYNSRYWYAFPRSVAIL